VFTPDEAGANVPAQFIACIPDRNQVSHNSKRYSMRAETEAVVDDIKQAISLLRRHL